MRLFSSSAGPVLATLIIAVTWAHDHCEPKCGDEEGNTVMCRNFCARSLNETEDAFLEGDFRPRWTGPDIQTRKGDPEIDAVLRSELQRIVGGSQAVQGQFPFIASLKYHTGKDHSNPKYFSHFCGGSAISDRFILTAAHCMKDFDVNKLWVSMGDHDTRVLDTNEKFIQAEKIIIHHNYEPRNFQHNDIALIKLKESIDPNNERQIITRVMDPEALEKKSQDLTAAGWGTTKSGGKTAKILRYVHLPYVSLADCKKAMGSGSIFDSSVCAGYVQLGAKDACQGDSGGPLVYTQGSEVLLAGLTSWGIGCARPGYAGVYTNVGFYADWIQKNMK